MVILTDDSPKISDPAASFVRARTSHSVIRGADSDMQGADLSGRSMSVLGGRWWSTLGLISPAVRAAGRTATLRGRPARLGGQPHPPSHHPRITAHIPTGLALILIFYIAQVCALDCGPHEYSHNGDTCCLECDPGMGVVSPCSPYNNTVCQNCSIGQTFSGRWSHLDTCRTCTNCPDHSHMQTPCNLTHDTQCVCDRDYFMEQGAGRCRQCDLCRPGTGGIRACNGTHNTVCGTCPSGTFSARWGRQGCVVCTYCGDSQVMLQMCTSKQDTVCIDIPDPAQFQTPTSRHLPQEDDSNDVTAYQGSNIIPVYCAILGLLVLGLVIYVVIVQRRRMALKAGNAAGSNPEQEGALLYHQRESSGSHPGSNTDLDISVLNPTLYKELSPLKQKEIENLIDCSHDNRGGWRTLARQLGYLSRQEEILSQAECYHVSPARCLLSDWSALPGATVGALSRALMAAGRHDAVQALQRGQEGSQGQIHISNRSPLPSRVRSIGLDERSRQDLSSQGHGNKRIHRPIPKQTQNGFHS